MRTMLSPGDIQAMREMRAAGAKIIEIAEASGISMSAAAKVTRGLSPHKSGGRQPSPRTRQVRAVTDKVAQVVASGGVNTSGGVAEAAGIDHALARAALLELRYQGKVAYRVTGRGDFEEVAWTGGRDVPDARPHAKIGTVASHTMALHPGDPTDFRNHATVAVGGPVTRRWQTPEPTPEPTPTPEPEPTPEPTPERAAATYPLLDALRARATTAVLLRATLAALPPGDDLRPILEARLSERLTPLEAEYLRFAGRVDE